MSRLASPFHLSAIATIHRWPAYGLAFLYEKMSTASRVRFRRRRLISTENNLFAGEKMFTRASKVLFTWAIALFASLVVFNNLTDYDSNYLFVGHVLRMDTTFPENRAMWRAIASPAFHHFFYWLIIVLEAAIAALCWAGGFRLIRSIKDAGRFDRTKGVAIAGLTLGILLWFTGFITVGGEWFLMWQSERWNGQEAAFRLVVIFAIVLLYLIQPDGQTDV